MRGSRHCHKDVVDRERAQRAPVCPHHVKKGCSPCLRAACVACLVLPTPCNDSPFPLHQRPPVAELHWWPRKC
eukprot:2864392-Karenia_brevis.AAC.1